MEVFTELFLFSMNLYFAPTGIYLRKIIVSGLSKTKIIDAVTLTNTTVLVLQVFDHQLVERWISRFGYYSPRSPDIILLDFSYWGALKSLF